MQLLLLFYSFFLLHLKKTKKKPKHLYKTKCVIIIFLFFDPPKNSFSNSVYISKKENENKYEMRSMQCQNCKISYQKVMQINFILKKVMKCYLKNLHRFLLAYK